MKTEYLDYEITDITHPLRLGLAKSYVHSDYDGPEDRRCGFADTLLECVEAINQLEGLEMSEEEEKDCAELIETEQRLEAMEERRQVLAEKCERARAMATIAKIGMTIDEVWTKSELEEIFGFHNLIWFYTPIFTRKGQDGKLYATRKWVEYQGTIYDVGALIRGKYDDTGVTLEHLQQFATDLATKQAANPA